MIAVALPLGLSVGTILRMLAGIALLYFVWPQAAFRLDDVLVEDRRLAQMGMMLTWMIVGGYVAATLHVLSLAFVVLWALCARLLFYRVRRDNRYRLAPSLAAFAVLLDHLVEIGDLLSRLREGARALAAPLARWLSAARRQLAAVAVVALVVGLAAYVRFGWNLENAALLYSDAYETVLWMKLLALGQVFPNGIYPQGYYITMAAVRALTQASPLPFEKFFGPLVGLSLVLSVMWTSWRMTGKSLLAALAAGCLYGLVLHLLPYTAPRQAASDAQELGDAMVLPLLWLVYQSWLTRRRGYRLGASALLTAVALIHPIALINAVCAAVAGTIAGWSVAGFDRTTFREYSWMVGLGALVSILPLALGLAGGVPILSTAIPFATGSGPASGLTGDVGTSLVALAAIALLFVVRLGWRLEDWELGVPVAAFLLWLFAFGIQQLPALGISNLALDVRSGELVSLADALGIGMGAFAIELLRQRYLPGGRGARSLPYALWAGAYLALLVPAPPRPLSDYTMDSDSYVAAFERIATTVPKFDWLAVSYDGYSLAVGQGYNVLPAEWEADATLATRWPAFVSGGHRTVIGEDYIFLFVQRWQLPSSAPTPALFDAEYDQARAETMRWIDRWQRRHGPMPIYFANADLTVYYLRRDDAPALG